MSYERFAALCKERNITPSMVAKLTGINPSTISHWKNGRYEPKFEKKKRIAAFFDVPVEYIDEDKEEDPVIAARKKMNEDEKALADLASKADPEQIKMTITFLKTIMGQ